VTPAQTAALAAVRARFDAVDDAIIAAITERLRLADEAAAIKGPTGAPVLDAPREARSRARRAALIADLLGRDHGGATDVATAAHDVAEVAEVAELVDAVFAVLVTASRARQARHQAYLAMDASHAQ